jgi:hypothetical protein
LSLLNLPVALLFLGKTLVEQTICESKGREYHFYSGAFSSNYKCVPKVTDGGVSCQSGTECQSAYCFITRDAKTDENGKYTGRCGYTGEVNYCQFAQLENGLIALDLRNAMCD